MKVKATTTFAGEICMAAGENRDVPESIAAPLLKCGYLEPVEHKSSEPDNTPVKKRPARSKTKVEE